MRKGFDDLLYGQSVYFPIVFHLAFRTVHIHLAKPHNHLSGRKGQLCRIVVFGVYYIFYSLNQQGIFTIYRFPSLSALLLQFLNPFLILLDTGVYSCQFGCLWLGNKPFPSIDIGNCFFLPYVYVLHQEFCFSQELSIPYLLTIKFEVVEKLLQCFEFLWLNDAALGQRGHFERMHVLLMIALYV